MHLRRSCCDSVAETESRSESSYGSSYGTSAVGKGRTRDSHLTETERRTLSCRKANARSAKDWRGVLDDGRSWGLDDMLDVDGRLLNHSLRRCLHGELPHKRCRLNEGCGSWSRSGEYLLDVYWSLVNNSRSGNSYLSKNRSLLDERWCRCSDGDLSHNGGSVAQMWVREPIRCALRVRAPAGQPLQGQEQRLRIV
ncbi:hypothetical protein MTO96_022655 [Rhipicephalus appendiculatus]